ncbi:VOC family protein [Terrabacter sp. Ter38]|uniref:VOC family protein n=1 Tax=Terrabacter sp. Ter38 TaxID=2926030 RepID=UPI0021178B56|nr:VOC family protein [Terrabacter sp. Ter38]
MTEFPRLMHTALDTEDARALAEFYRALLGLHYRPGDEPPAGGAEDDADWLVLLDAEGVRRLAVQQVDGPLPRSTWPTHEVPMQLHVDYAVPTFAELERHRDRALSLGAQVLLDRTDDDSEPLVVLADPAGHPFCLLVAP